MAEKKKINWLLILQGWAMLWVVIGHSYIGQTGARPVYVDRLFDFAYSFHMPLFMLVSGYLFFLTRLNVLSLNGWGNNWTYSLIIRDKTIRLLLPGLVFSIISFAVKIAFPGEMSRQVGLNFNELIHAYLYPYDNPMRELWFIITLFWLMLMAPLWRAVVKRDWSMWSMLIILTLLHFWHPKTDFLCIQRVFSYSIWFYLGLVICKTDAVNRLFNKLPWLTLLAGIAIYVVGMYTGSFVTTIGGIVLSFGIALLSDRYLPKLFFSFRNYTYQIFLMGIFAQMAVKIAYRYVSMPYLVAYVLCIFVGLYVPVALAKFVEMINWKPLSLCYGLKTK